MPYYKAFLKSKDDTLISKISNFKYQINKVYKHYGEIELCKKGFHFCRTPKDCYNYYDPINNNVVICEVEPLGKLLWKGGDKLCTDEIKIGRILSKDEIEICSTFHTESHFDQEIIFENGVPKGKYYIYTHDAKCWYKDKLLHRDDKDPVTNLTLPAIIFFNGVKSYSNSFRRASAI